MANDKVREYKIGVATGIDGDNAAIYDLKEMLNPRNGAHARSELAKLVMKSKIYESHKFKAGQTLLEVARSLHNAGEDGYHNFGNVVGDALITFRVEEDEARKLLHRARNQLLEEGLAA